MDLTGANPTAATSSFDLPRAKAFYGPLPDQLKSPESFASRLKAMLAARAKLRLAEAELMAAPDPGAAGLCVLVLRLPDGRLAVTVLNFGRADADATVEVTARGPWADIVAGKPVEPSDDGRLRVRGPALTGTTFAPVVQ